jgi:hypothetical protein
VAQQAQSTKKSRRGKHTRRKREFFRSLYSRVSANLYTANTPAMNGWEASAHLKLIRFLGAEGDVSHYDQNPGGFSQSVTLIMGGPRVTAHAAGFSLFAHGLAGIVHEKNTVSPSLGFGELGYNAVSFAAGAGADIPLFLRLKARFLADYIENSRYTRGYGSSSHFRFGIGLAYHF